MLMERKLFARSSHHPQVDGELGGVQEVSRAGRRGGNRGAGSPIRSSWTRPLGALPTLVCSTYLCYRPHVRTQRGPVSGRAGLATLRKGRQLFQQVVCPRPHRHGALHPGGPHLSPGAGRPSAAGLVLPPPPSPPSSWYPLLPGHRGGTGPLCPLGSALSGLGPWAARGLAWGPAMSPPHRREAANLLWGGSLLQLDSESLREQEWPSGGLPCGVSAPSSYWGRLKKSQGPPPAPRATLWAWEPPDTQLVYQPPRVRTRGLAQHFPPWLEGKHHLGILQNNRF